MRKKKLEPQKSLIGERTLSAKTPRTNLHWHIKKNPYDAETILNNNKDIPNSDDFFQVYECYKHEIADLIKHGANSRDIVYADEGFVDTQKSRIKSEKLEEESEQNSKILELSTEKDHKACKETRAKVDERLKTYKGMSITEIFDKMAEDKVDSNTVNEVINILTERTVHFLRKAIKISEDV
jgi:hypothetical protein